MPIEFQTTAPVTIRVAAPDSPHGTVEITVSSGPPADAELLAHPAGEVPVAPMVSSCQLHRRVVHAFTTHLSDLNQARLDNLCCHSPRGQMKCRVCHLNKALATHLNQMKVAFGQLLALTPPGYRAITRALQAGPNSTPPPYSHAFAFHLNEANKVGLAHFVYLNPALEGALDNFINDALTHRLNRYPASDNYRRQTRGRKRTPAKPKAQP